MEENNIPAQASRAAHLNRLSWLPMGVLPVLFLLAALLAAAACWKRLLGFAVSRFAHGRAFRLSVGQFFFAGLADLRLVLHVGPVREMRVRRLSFGLATKGGGNGSSTSGGNSSGAIPQADTVASLWQALMTGQLLVPLRLQGVSLTLASPHSEPLSPGPEAAAEVQQSGTHGVPGSAAGGQGANGAHAGSGGTGRRRAAGPPLWVLGHLPLQLSELTVQDEERGVHLSLQHASLTLHSAQQLLLEGLSAALLPASLSGAASPGGSGSREASPCRLAAALHGGWGRGDSAAGPQAGSTAAEQYQGDGAVPFVQLDRLLLEHRHDGSFSLQHFQLGQAPAAPSYINAAAADGNSLQAVSLQLGALSLVVSKQLLVWLERQHAAAAAKRARRQPSASKLQAVEDPIQQDKRQRLPVLLALMPREVEAAISSCNLATESCSGTSGGKALPLQAGLCLQQVSCRLVKGADPESDGGSSGSGGPGLGTLVSVSAGWQRLSASLGAASCSNSTRQQQLPPPAVAMRSGAAEWSLELCRDAAGTASSQQQQQAEQQQQDLSRLSLASKVSIGALHTDICHPAVPPLTQQLRHAATVFLAARSQTLSPAQAPSAQAARSSSRPASSEAAPGINTGEGPQMLQPRSRSAAAQPLLAAWQGSVSLGDGSRLLFSDAEGRCCWSSGLASCRLNVRGGGIGGGSSSSTGGISGSFEAVGIEMHAAAATSASVAGQQSASQFLTPPQMLAAELLRVQVEQSAALEPQQQQETTQQQVGQQGGIAVDATTVGVHLLLQQQQLAHVASVVMSLLPACKTAGAADGGSSAAEGSQAAVAAVAAGKGRQRRRLSAPRLAFSCSDTLLLLPTTVAVPSEHSAGGQLQLLPAACAVMSSSVSGTVAGGLGGSSVEGCSLLYCDGPLSQRFPSSTTALKEQAKVCLLTLDRAALRKLPTAAVVEAAASGPVASADNGSRTHAGDDSNNSIGSMQLEMGSLSACADADGLLCLAAVADSAAQQLTPLLAAVPFGSRGSSRREPESHMKGRQRLPLSVTLGQLRLDQPLYAPGRGRDMALEVAAVHATVGAQQLCQHSVATAGAVLSMDGTPVLRWCKLAATLRLPDPAQTTKRGRLVAVPLPWFAAADGNPNMSARTTGVASQASEAQELTQQSDTHSSNSSYEAYHRARLEAWLDADAAVAPSGAASAQDATGHVRDAATAAALGVGPASTLDVQLGGAELVVPHDGEPGPTERYAELYFKALETAMQHHLYHFKQLGHRLRSASQKSAAADLPGGGGRQDESGNEGRSGSAGAGSKKGQGPKLFPMQINMVAEEAALRFEHHPMEAWMASRGPLLQQMAVQQHLWGEVAAAVQPADTASPLHAGMVESAFETVAAASQQAWDGLLQSLLMLYRSKLQQTDLQQQQATQQVQEQLQVEAKQIETGAESAAHGGGTPDSEGGSSGTLRAPPGHDLMMISCRRLQGLVVLCCGSEEARATVRQQIAALDAASENVPMAKMLKLHAHVALEDFVMRLAGTTRPFVAASSVLLSGTASVARQATAPPQTRQRQLPVGAYRCVAIPVTVKGCRPPFKFYTDLRLEAGVLTVCHSQGLDPTMALLGLAGKRLSPSDPDRSVARPPHIPWWDDMRYMWRGRVDLSVSTFGLTLGGRAVPNINDTSERMEVEASNVRGRLLSGSYELGLEQLGVTLHRAAGVQQLGGTLLALPFVHAPQARVRLEVDWKLPGGRPAEQHHLFPIQLPPQGTLQEPIYAGVVYKADSWDLSLHVKLGQTHAAGSDTGAEAGAAGVAAVGFLGGHQIQWMKQFVAVMSRLPPQMRAVSRRGTFFWRKPPATGAPKKGIGKLTQKLCINVAAAPLEVVHYAADPSDPSHGIRLHAPSASYTACYLLNQPLPSFLKLPMHARSSRSRRQQEATRSMTLSMDVQAGSVTVHKVDSPRQLADAGGSGALGASPRVSAALRGTAGVENEGLEEKMLDLLDDLIAPVSQQQEPVICAGTVAVTQDTLALPESGSGSPGADPIAQALQPHVRTSRPLRVLISDCRVLVDRAARDAVWGAVEHLISAFTTSLDQQRQNLSSAAVHSMFPPSASPSPTPAFTTSPSMPWSASSPVAQLQRQVSESQSQRGTPQPNPTGDLPGSTPGSFRRSLDGPPVQATRTGSGGISEGGDELLNLLLQQRQAEEESDDRRRDADRDGDGQRQGMQPGADGLLHPGTAVDEEDEDDDGPDEQASAGCTIDDVAGQLKYIVEVKDLQIACEAETAQGRLLLAARSGRLRGLHLPDSGLNVTALLMEQVSAYIITQTDVDPDAPMLWLQPTPSGYQLPSGRGLMGPVRRIFEPIQISLRHSKVAAGNASRRRSNLPSGNSSRQFSSPNASFTSSVARGEELVLQVPEVLAVMDGCEFEVLVDVITMMQSQGPTVETVGAEAALLAELEGDEVEAARQLYALLRQQLAELRQASLLLRTSLGLQAFVSQLAPASSEAGELLPPLAITHFLASDRADFVGMQYNTAAELAVAMREHLAASSAAAAAVAQGAGAGVEEPKDTAVGILGMSSHAVTQEDEALQQQEQQQEAEAQPQLSPAAPVSQQRASALAALPGRQLGARQQDQQQALLLRWVEEQEGGAYESVEKAKGCLLALKAVARKRQQKRSASRMRLQLDRVVWQMCTLSREPFVQASIRHLTLDKFKNKDHSGSAKFVIGRIEVLDSQGVLGPGPGIGPGVILSVWNPDASWERDDMLRVVASMGVPTQTHVIYEHLDVIVHPIAFHLTETIAVAFWEYFFPREDESKARAAAAFARSVAVPAAAAARHRRSTTALPTELTSSQQSSPLAGSPKRRTAQLPAGDSSQPGSGQQSPRLLAGTPKASVAVNAGWRSAPSKLHRRTSSATMESLSRQSTLGGSATAAAAAAAAEASLLDAAAETAAALSGAVPGGSAASNASGGSPSITFHLQRFSASGISHLQRTSATALLFEAGGLVAASAAASAAGSTFLGSAGSTILGSRLYRPFSSTSLANSEESVAVHVAAPPHRKVRFVHVKINRAHCRATYEGYPLTFNDLKLVIDNRTYTNIEGRWRDLFNKLKWDIVKSVVKSVAGLQGRKFKELLPAGMSGEDPEGSSRRKAGLFAQLQALGKGRKDGAGSSGGGGGVEAAPSEEDLRSQHKRRMLFGQMPPVAPPGATQKSAPRVSDSGGSAGAAAGSMTAQSPREAPAPPAVSPLARSAAASASNTPHGPLIVDEVAGVGEIYPAPLPPGHLAAGLPAAAPAEASPFASGAFGSTTLPELSPQPSPTTSAEAEVGRAELAAGTSSAAAAGGSKGHLPTPRWAAKLASKAQKGFNKLRDSLQD